MWSERAKPNGAVIRKNCDLTQESHLLVRTRGAKLTALAGLQHGRVADAAEIWMADAGHPA